MSPTLDDWDEDLEEEGGLFVDDEVQASITTADVMAKAVAEAAASGKPFGGVAQLPEAHMVPIDKVQPYFNNPRKISPEAVEAVRKSISEFGMQQPILVDANYVIIAGHTRLQALRAIGATEVPVYVADMSEDRAREFRLVDNRTSELTAWDEELLILEVREWEKVDTESWFPDLNTEIALMDEVQATQEQVDDAVAKVTKIPDRALVLVTDVECPGCAQVFRVNTNSLPGLTPADLKMLEALQQAADEASQGR